MATLTLEMDGSVWVEIPAGFPSNAFPDVDTWADSVGATLTEFQDVPQNAPHAPTLLRMIYQSATDRDSDVLLACIPDGEAFIETVRIDLAAAAGPLDELIDQILRDRPEALTAPPETGEAFSATLGSGTRIVRFEQTTDDNKLGYVSVRFVWRFAQTDVVIGFDSFDLTCAVLLVPLVEQLASGLTLVPDRI